MTVTNSTVPPVGETPIKNEPLLTSRRMMIVAAVVAIWVIARLIGWIGYSGADDQYYARFAHLLHRVPMNHMEFRMTVVLSIRAAMELFGTSETAVCMAPLFYSAMLFCAVAWFVGWPRNYSWTATGSMLLVSLIPIDVGFASYPSPAALSAGLTAMGVVCILKGRRAVGILGAALLALAFMTHFLNFFFVGLFCLTLLALDWRRFLIAVVACVLFSGGLLATEMTTYKILINNPFAHFDSFKALTEGVPEDGRSETKLGFFLEPIKILILSKPFGFGLLLLLVSGVRTFKRMTIEQKIVWITTIGFWFWLGYGTLKPTSYRPASRGMHYYTPLAFGLCALVPSLVEMLFATRKKLARALVGLLLLMYIASIGLSGTWGSQVDASRALLEYARQHPEEKFLTDVYSLSDMYVLNGFELPANVMVLDSKAQQTHLLVNKEPEGHTDISFPHAAEADELLINLSRDERPAEPEFTDFVAAHAGEVVATIPPRYRPVFVPLAKFVGDWGFALRDKGAEVRKVKKE